MFLRKKAHNLFSKALKIGSKKTNSVVLVEDKVETTEQEEIVKVKKTTKTKKTTTEESISE